MIEVDWRKHRAAQDYYDIDFTEAMAADETITAFAVEVLTLSLAPVDRTAEFVSDDPVIRAHAVTILLDAASEGTQAATDYEVVGKATTSLGRTLVAGVILAVFDTE